MALKLFHMKLEDAPEVQLTFVETEPGLYRVSTPGVDDFARVEEVLVAQGSLRRYDLTLYDGSTFGIETTWINFGEMTAYLLAHVEMMNQEGE